jgi:hypothetical protein
MELRLVDVVVEGTLLQLLSVSDGHEKLFVNDC